VSPSEPGTYWGGALKGFKEGAAGGAQGFVEGVKDSPVALVKGLATLLTQNPVTSVKQQVQAIGRIPDAIRASATDPVGWGHDVGVLTGTTELGLAAPKILSGGAKATVRGGGALADTVSPDLVGAVSPRLGNALRVLQKMRNATTTATDTPVHTPPIAGPMTIPPEDAAAAIPETVKAPAVSIPAPESIAAPTPKTAPDPMSRIGTPAAPSPAPEMSYQRNPAIDTAERDFMQSIVQRFGAKSPPTVSAPPPPPRPDNIIGPRNYFLKTDAVAPTPTVGRGAVGIEDLPEAWKPATAPPVIAPRDIGGSELAGAYQRELVQRGIKTADAIKAVRNNPDLPPDVKTQILAALMKAKGGK
jgi:hypothetical protein